jgi:hypothetical protein
MKDTNQDNLSNEEAQRVGSGRKCRDSMPSPAGIQACYPSEFQHVYISGIQLIFSIRV